MNNLHEKFKKAFSLLELTICILIVSIIIVVCVPLIMDQMKKTEEYSYFLGYKTVEKLGAQIIAYGDPIYGDNSTAMNKQDMEFRSAFSNSVIHKIDKLSKIITPKAHAGRTVIVSFPSYEYDFARLCQEPEHNSNVLKNYEDEAGNGFTDVEISNMGCLGMYNDNDKVQLRFGCKGGSYAKQVIRNPYSDVSFETFCSNILSECRSISTYSSYNLQKEVKREILNQADNRSEYYQCIIYVQDDTTALTGASGSIDTMGVYPTTYLEASCNNNGYSNVTGTTKTGCFCNPGTVMAVNHPNVCCSTPSVGNVAYADKNGNCVTNGCKFGAYNESHGEDESSCCPDHSYYSRTLGYCACAQGYTPKVTDGVKSCEKISPLNCPKGFHAEPNGTAENAVCVVNPPIIKANRFCELIVDNYNVSYSNCDASVFNGTKSLGDGYDTVNYNKSLFDAMTSGSTPYLSAQAVGGAFNSVSPNIVFANGVKLWILGDKVASIAGLSFNPTDYSPEINGCVDAKVYSQSECNSLEGTKYFCKGGNRCYKIDPGNSARKLADARNCCDTVDFEDLRKTFMSNTYLRDPRAYAVSGFTVFVDITGDKDSDQGGGTLWKDVFPFYVGSNGTVYPAYPLNASKSDISLYQGGNSSALNSDVYFFDVITREDGSKYRKKQMAYTSIPYSRAQCFALQVSAFTPYCQNLGSKFRLSREGKTYQKMDQFIYSSENPCWQHRCYVHVKNKIKFL